MRFLLNIRFRLTLGYLVVVAILVALFGTMGYLLLVDGLARNIVTPFDMRMADITDMPDGTRRVTGFTSVTGQIGAEAYNMVQVPVSRLIEEASEDGTIEIRAFGAEPVLVDRALLTGSDSPSGKGMYAYLFFSRDLTDGKLVVAARSEAGQASILALFGRTVLISAGATLVLAGILGYFLVSRMLDPVQAITRAAKDIEENSLGRRLAVHGKDEVGELASTLNQMLERLDAAFVREREFTADASHELRTPLAIAQGEATLALREERSREDYQKALESISRQISRTSSLINRLLFLARSDDRLEMVMTEVDLKSLLNEIVSDAQVLCEPRGIALQSDLSDRSDTSATVKVRGDAVRLRELFLNLLDNAVRYTPDGRTITVSLRRDSRYARAAVRDTGSGIPKEHLPNVFRRFYRVDKSRSREEGGAGLGLAISQRIAQVHGGRIEVESEVARGSTFTVFLPLLKSGK